MLTYEIGDYIAWRNMGQWLKLKKYSMLLVSWQYVKWEPTPEVERIMRMKPEKGGPLFA